MPGGLTVQDRRRIEVLVDSRVGIVRRLQRFSPSPVDPPVPVLYGADLSDWDLADQDQKMGVGKGANESDAIRAAIGEAVDRYCAGQIDVASLPRASEKQLGDSAVSPRDLVLYSDRQYASTEIRYPRCDSQVAAHWATGVDLTDGSVACLPAT